MFCKHCGAEIADEAVICVKCGKPVAEMPVQYRQKMTNRASVSTYCHFSFRWSDLYSILHRKISIP